MSKTHLPTNKPLFPNRILVTIYVTTLVITKLLSPTYAAEVKNEQIAPQKNSTRVVADTPEVERLKKLVAFEVAEEAKKEVILWVQWLISPILLGFTVLGIKTFFDVQTSIRKTLEDEFNKFKEYSTEASSEAIRKFNDEAEEALKNINDKAKQASEIIDQQTNKVKSFAAENMGVISASLIRKTKSNLRRMVYDAENNNSLPGKLVRSEEDNPSEDKAVNDVFDLLGITYKFFQEVFNYDLCQDSELIATVHYSTSYDNAYWNENQLVIGDGDGKILQTFILLDIVVGEISKKLTKKLLLKGEPGALIIHLGDVFAVLAVQWNKNQTVENADWLIGKGLLASSVSGRGLRDLREPGTAYNDPVLGKDPQPMHFKDKYTDDRDLGGVHINSGIPSRAFYLVASELGGHAWEKAGKIWYESAMQIQEKNPIPTFLEFAQETYKVAGSKYGQGSREQLAVRDGWESVGISAEVTV